MARDKNEYDLDEAEYLDDPEAEEDEADITAEEAEGRIYRAKGCGHCGSVGFRGRKAIFEMMHMNSETRNLAFKRAPVNQIRDAAIRSGMRDLLHDGKLKILNGITTPPEVAKFAQAEALLAANVDLE